MELVVKDVDSCAGSYLVTADFRPAASESLVKTPQIGIPGFVPWNNQLPSYFFATLQRHGASTADRVAQQSAETMPYPGSTSSVCRCVHLCAMWDFPSFASYALPRQTTKLYSHSTRVIGCAY